MTEMPAMAQNQWPERSISCRTENNILDIFRWERPEERKSKSLIETESDEAHQLILFEARAHTHTHSRRREHCMLFLIGIRYAITNWGMRVCMRYICYTFIFIWMIHFRLMRTDYYILMHSTFLAVKLLLYKMMENDDYDDDREHEHQKMWRWWGGKEKNKQQQQQMKKKNNKKTSKKCVVTSRTSRQKKRNKIWRTKKKTETKKTLTYISAYLCGFKFVLVALLVFSSRWFSHCSFCFGIDFSRLF